MQYSKMSVAVELGFSFVFLRGGLSMGEGRRALNACM